MPEAAADADIEALKEFVAKARKSGGDKFSALRAEAEQALRALTGPVRIAVAGEFSAGKSTLVNILIGEDFAETGVMATDMPPVVFRHGDDSALSGGWWDQPDRRPSKEGDVEVLVNEKVDFITVDFPAAILNRVEIVDVPGLNSPTRDEAELIRAISWADAVIWCTNAVNSWRESERHTWSQLPAPLRANSILVVTHVDLPSIAKSVGRVASRMNKEAGKLFKGIVLLAAPKAVAAAPGGQIVDPAAWEESGGKALLEGIAEVVAGLKAERIRAGKAFVDERLAQAMAELEAMTSTTAPQVLSAWKSRATALSLKADGLDGEGFVALAADLLRDIGGMLSHLKGGNDRTAWLADEFTAAAGDATRLDGGKEAEAETAAMLLLQMGRELERDLA